MPWIKLEKPSEERKKWLKPVYDRLSNPMLSRAPFQGDYPYSYGSPYSGSSEDKYNYNSGDKINMDPEKYIHAK